MLSTLILILIVGVIVSVIPMDALIKKVAYIILAIAVLLVILPLVGIHVPLR